MKIGEYGNVSSASPLRRRNVGGSNSSGGLFSSLLGIAEQEEASQLAQLSDVSATNSTSLLALQEISEEEIRRKKMLQRGHNLLDSLERLRGQLLLGEVPVSTLREIGDRLARQRELTADPQLLELMDEIELRAAVELTKLEMAAARHATLPDA